MTLKTLAKGCMAVLLALSMVACSSGNTTSTESSGSDVIKLGCSGPLTGGAAVYGTAVKVSAEIAVEEINALGGLQFEFNMQDDEADAEKATTAYGVLTDWGMQASLFTVTSGSGAAVAPLYNDDNIFALTPSGSSTALVYSDDMNYPTNFQMCFTDPNQGIASANYLAEKFADETIAVIYKNDDVYSAGVYDKFMAQAGEVGIEPVYKGTFDDSNASDFNVQLTQAKDAGATLVYLPIYYQPAALILQQADQMGYSPIFVGIDGMDGVLDQLGDQKALAEGVYLLTPFAADAQDEKTANYVAKYVERTGEIPNQFGADAYDCVYALYQAMTTAGVDPSWSTDDITAALIEQFTTMTFDGVTGLNMTWSENGEVSKAPKAVIIKDGVYVSVE